MFILLYKLVAATPYTYMYMYLAVVSCVVCVCTDGIQVERVSVSEMVSGVFAVECVTSSSPPLTVVWMKDGQPLSNTSTGLNFTAVGRGIIMQTVAASVGLHMEIQCSALRL